MQPLDISLAKEVKLRLIIWILLLQEFDIEIRNKKWTQNVVVGHLSILNEQKREKLLLDHSFPDDKMFALVQK